MGQQHFHHTTETNSIEGKSKRTRKTRDGPRLIRSVYRGSVTFLITLQKSIRLKQNQKEQGKTTNDLIRSF